MEKRYFGVIRAEIDNQARRVVMKCNRGPVKLDPVNMAKIAAWALDGVRDLKKAGYSIDTSRIAKYLKGV